MSILAENNSKPWIGAITVTAIAGVLYFLTAARDIVVGDSPELIMAAVTLGVAHAPGYPLFTMLGHLFSLLPFGSIPFRVNLLSVVCDALTIGVVYFSTFRLTRSQLAAAFAALLLAVDPIFWEWSLAAEVFPLNNLLAAVLILLLVAWHQHPERSAFLIAAFFVAGLALTNHQTIVLLGPAFCFILWRRRSFLLARPSLLAIGAAVFVVGLLPYLYVPWAAAHHPVRSDRRFVLSSGGDDHSCLRGPLFSRSVQPYLSLDSCLTCMCHGRRRIILSTTGATSLPFTISFVLSRAEVTDPNW